MMPDTGQCPAVTGRDRAQNRCTNLRCSGDLAGDLVHDGIRRVPARSLWPTVQASRDCRRKVRVRPSSASRWTGPGSLRDARKLGLLLPVLSCLATRRPGMPEASQGESVLQRYDVMMSE